MKIFITGIAGFLGSHIADRMLALGHQVAGNDNFLGGYKSNIPEGVEFYEVDCCEQQRMTEIIKGSDVVIHCAATAHEGLSVFSPAFITKNIFQASVSTISAAVSTGVRRFVFCSSMARYGHGEPPFKESDMPCPADPYAIAKVASEDVLKTMSFVHGLEWNIAIPHNIVGPRQRYDDPFRNVMSIMINRCLQGKPPIIYGDGSQQRCFSYIDDCVYCIEQLALGPHTYQIVNIGPDEGTITIKELAEIIAEECNYTRGFMYMPERPSEVKLAVCSSDRARELLGYMPTIDVREAVKRTADWIRSQGPKPFDYSFPLEIVNDLTPLTWKDRLM